MRFRRRAATKVSVFPISVRCAANQWFPAPTTASSAHHFGVGRGLVDEHQPARFKHPLLSDPTPPRRATSGRSCSAACRLFLTVILWRSKKRCTALRLPGIRRLRIAATTSSRVKSGCLSITLSSHSACFSNGETLPPIGFAATLPVARHRCTHLIAELGLKSNRSAASRRDAPASTAPITRARKSPEYGFGIAQLPESKTNASKFAHPTALGNPHMIPPNQNRRDML